MPASQSLFKKMVFWDRSNRRTKNLVQILIVQSTRQYISWYYYLFIHLYRRELYIGPVIKVALYLWLQFMLTGGIFSPFSFMHSYIALFYI